jgi:hypothetical protein
MSLMSEHFSAIDKPQFLILLICYCAVYAVNDVCSLEHGFPVLIDVYRYNDARDMACWNAVAYRMNISCFVFSDHFYGLCVGWTTLLNSPTFVRMYPWC